jgi:hypothetical protein
LTAQSSNSGRWLLDHPVIRAFTPVFDRLLPGDDRVVWVNLSEKRPDWRISHAAGVQVKYEEHDWFVPPNL